MNHLIIDNISAFFLLILLFLIGLTAFNTYLFYQARKFEAASRLFFSGKNGKDLEEIIIKQIKDIEELDNEIQELYDISNRLNASTAKCVQKIGLTRFNPFKEVGGNQSFAIALLDSKNSGIIISSLHTREGSRIYAKPIITGKSDKYPLTEEEEHAIKVASLAKNNSKL